MQIVGQNHLKVTDNLEKSRTSVPVFTSTSRFSSCRNFNSFCLVGDFQLLTEQCLGNNFLENICSHCGDIVFQVLAEREKRIDSESLANSTDDLNEKSRQAQAQHLLEEIRQAVHEANAKG